LNFVESVGMRTRMGVESKSMEPMEKAKALIEGRIQTLVDGFDFDKRKKDCPNECPCYGENKPCHKMVDLNCFLCYCPEYDLNKSEGGCKLGNPQGKGKWFVHAALPEGKIWDCSDCTHPHEKEVAKTYFRKMFNID